MMNQSNFLGVCLSQRGKLATTGNVHDDEGTESVFVRISFGDGPIDGDARREDRTVSSQKIADHGFPEGLPGPAGFHLEGVFMEIQDDPGSRFPGSGNGRG